MEGPDPSKKIEKQTPSTLKKRIAIVSTKQPGTNPRMRKNADALHLAGYEILVLYAYNTPWADMTDQTLFNDVLWKHQRIGGHPKLEKWRYFAHRLRRKLASWCGITDLEFCPARAQYLHALHEFQPHLVLGHNPGSLPVLTKWAKYTGGEILFDAEDYHAGEYPEGSQISMEIRKFEDRHLYQIHTITAASPLIGKAYNSRFPHIDITVVNNAFESKFQPAFDKLNGDPLKIVWFSQVVGLDRGIQEFLGHLEPLAILPLVISIIGACDFQTKRILENCLVSDQHQIDWLPPCPEKQLMETIAQHHVGLAVEPGFSPNNKIARSNKLFTYPLCGCWTLASKTPAQDEFYEQNPMLGQTIDLHDGAAWANSIEALSQDLESLLHQRKAAWEMARDHLNWETESQNLTSLVQSILDG